LIERPISSLTYGDLEKLCDIAEEAARRYIFSRVKREYVSDISISINLENRDFLNVDIEVEIELSPLCRKINAKDLAEGSVKASFEAIEKYLRKIRSAGISELTENGKLPKTGEIDE